jgi:hypothetical protein
MGSGYWLCLPDVVLGAFAHDVPTEGGCFLGRHTATQKRIDMVSAPIASGYRRCARSREGRGCAAQRCATIEPFSTPESYPQSQPLDVRVSPGDDGDDGDSRGEGLHELDIDQLEAMVCHEVQTHVDLEPPRQAEAAVSHTTSTK